MTKEQAVEMAMTEAKDHGLAFVEDEFTDDDVYNPLVDRENAEMWLREKLEMVAKL